MTDEGTFTRYKKIFALLTGFAIAAISAYNSKNGFVSDQNTTALVIMGWIFSAACMGAQFMFTSEFNKLNWTVIVLGGLAYLYSIPTNYIGLELWKGAVTSQYDFVNWLAAIFMDVYPEAAIAWALGDSRLGDAIGNLFKAAKRGEELTDTAPRRRVNIDNFSKLPHKERYDA